MCISVSNLMPTKIAFILCVFKIVCGGMFNMRFHIKCFLYHIELSYVEYYLKDYHVIVSIPKIIQSKKDATQAIKVNVILQVSN